MKSVTSVIFKNAKRSDKMGNRILYFLSLVIVFGVLAIGMSAFAYKITKELAVLNQTYAFINILLLMNFVLLFAKSIFESINVLYFSKDLKILLRMPIKSKDILHAKMLNMITSEYQMEVIMLGIPMIVYGILTGVNFLFYLYMFIILLVLPVIPISLTALIISVIMRFTNNIKNKSKAMYITIILSMILVGFFTMEFSMSNNVLVDGFQGTLLRANGVAESISNYFVLIKPIMNTLLNYNNLNGIKNLILFLLETGACYIVVLLIVSKIYLKGAIGATINGKLDKKNNRELELQDFKQREKRNSYVLKELKTLVRAPIFNIQCLIMPILSPIITLATAVAFIKIGQGLGLDILGLLSQMLNSVTGVAAILSIGQLFYMLNFNSIIAISREGKSSKLMKYIPIDLSKQFKLKMFIGVLINIISAILLTIFYYLISHNIISTLTIFISLLGLNLIGEKFKLLIDIRNPKINWDSEYTMLKHNTNIMFELFYTLGIIGLIILISIIMPSTKFFISSLVIVLVVANIITDKIYINKGVVKKVPSKNA